MAVQEKAFVAYDPRVQYEGEADEAARSVVWTSKSEDWAREAIFKGKSIHRSPYYEGDPFKRKGDLVYKYSDEEWSELLKCALDFKHFLTYCKIKLPSGDIDNFKLRPYQHRQIEQLLNDKYCLFLWSRQSGKTVGVALYMLWKALFNPDFHIAILANKSGTSGEVLTKVKSIYFELPFFMKGGVTGWNGGTICFDNGSKIYTGVTTLDALNGKTANLLYMDEYAFVGKGGNKVEFQKEFLANALPVVSSQQGGQVIMSSTPNGKDYFFELCNGALRGENQFSISVVKWHEIPGRDEKWAQEQISATGIDKFKIQYECSFDTSSDSLLSMKTMKRLTKWRKLYETDVYDMLTSYEQYLTMDPDLDIDFENDYILMSVDIAEGLKQDYSVIQLVRMEIDEKTGDVFFRQFAMWRSNEVGLEDFANVVSELFCNFNEDKTRLLVERNTYGDTLFLHMKMNTQHEVPMESICKFKRTADDLKPIKGLRIDATKRNIAVKSFKSMMDVGKLIVRDETTIKEVENFQKNRKGKYEASIGHDDAVTPLTNFAYFVQLADAQFVNWLEDYAEDNDYEIDVDKMRSVASSASMTDSEVEGHEVDESMYNGMSASEQAYMEQILGSAS